MQEKECVKCGLKSSKNKEIFKDILCPFCSYFAPSKKEDFEAYISEKVKSSEIDTYRKQNKLSGERQKFGMVEKAKKGEIMSRAPFGYKIEKGKLIPSENSVTVEGIFLDFQNNEISLNRLAKKYGFSVNGLKKILRNFSYIGKIKFNGELYKSSHTPLISTTLFNHVQDKLERLGIK